jgi:hypothetical protein
MLYGEQLLKKSASTELISLRRRKGINFRGAARGRDGGRKMKKQDNNN